MIYTCIFIYLFTYKYTAMYTEYVGVDLSFAGSAGDLRHRGSDPQNTRKELPGDRLNRLGKPSSWDEHCISYGP